MSIAMYVNKIIYYEGIGYFYSVMLLVEIVFYYWVEEEFYVVWLDIM